jgi:hypothetical protein
LGTAEVIFVNRVDAMKAITKFHGQTLEGWYLTTCTCFQRGGVRVFRHMILFSFFRKGNFVGAFSSWSEKRDATQEVIPEPQEYRWRNEHNITDCFSMTSFVSPRGFRGGRRGRFAGGRSGRMSRRAPKTAEELDAEMQQYMSGGTDVPAGASVSHLP